MIIELSSATRVHTWQHGRAMACASRCPSRSCSCAWEAAWLTRRLSVAVHQGSWSSTANMTFSQVSRCESLVSWVVIPATKSLELWMHGRVVAAAAAPRYHEQHCRASAYKNRYIVRANARDSTYYCETCCKSHHGANKTNGWSVRQV